jgi:hypothetical protein
MTILIPYLIPGPARWLRAGPPLVSGLAASRIVPLTASSRGAGRTVVGMCFVFLAIVVRSFAVISRVGSDECCG